MGADSALEYLAPPLLSNWSCRPIVSLIAYLITLAGQPAPSVGLCPAPSLFDSLHRERQRVIFLSLSQLIPGKRAGRRARQAHFVSANVRKRTSGRFGQSSRN